MASCLTCAAATCPTCRRRCPTQSEFPHAQTGWRSCWLRIRACLACSCAVRCQTRASLGLQATALVHARRVIGHGMNAVELAKNPRLASFFVRNLNKEPDGWAMEDDSLDAVTCCVRWEERGGEQGHGMAMEWQWNGNGMAMEWQWRTTPWMP